MPLADMMKRFRPCAKTQPIASSLGGIWQQASRSLGEWMKLAAKIDILHVPYRGGGPQLIDLLGGHVDCGFVALPVIAPHLKAGKLRAIAVTSLQRSPAIPDVPTLDESGLRGLDVSQWWGLLAPANTPPPIIDKLAGNVTEAAKLPGVRASFDELGAVPALDTPEQFGAFMRSEVAKYRQVVRQTGIKLD